MKFVETPIFTKAVKLAFEDDDYRMLQTVLLLRRNRDWSFRVLAG
jgi:hypothetical protein